MVWHSNKDKKRTFTKNLKHKNEAHASSKKLTIKIINFPSKLTDLIFKGVSNIAEYTTSNL